ncbi:MAG: hypothetical protein VX527_03530 [Planctomycetota bacterium]|nr:hypothetical protein [Planctomycetota bacterium]
MGESQPRNRALERILEDMLSARERAETWVKTDAELDPESQRLMGDMNRGDQDSIQAFANWLKALQEDLPITVSSPDGGRTWTLTVDQVGRSALSEQDSDMLDAMSYMLFDGPEPSPGNQAANNLLGMGLPERLRQDLSDS